MPVADRNRNRTRKAPSGRLFRYGGFTLVELVAVLVIAAVVAAYAAPRLFDNGVFRERGYADDIAASLRYARRIAIASDCNVRFTVNAAGYNAAQPTVRCNTGGAWGVAVLAPDRRALANATPAGVAVVGAVLEFRPTGGLVNAAGPINVGAFAVSVDQTTGTVSVH